MCARVCVCVFVCICLRVCVSVRTHRDQGTSILYAHLSRVRVQRVPALGNVVMPVQCGIILLEMCTRNICKLFYIEPQPYHPVDVCAGECYVMQSAGHTRTLACGHACRGDL